MNPMPKGRGLSLGASCDNRHHDRCPGDIYSSIDVSVHRHAAAHTTEMGLTLAVLFCTVSTGTTRARRIGRVDRMQWHTGKSGLIGKEETELPT
jgi:hypothetical protein